MRAGGSRRLVPVEPAEVALVAVGAIMRWPEAYGYLFRSTKARSPRWTTRPVSSSASSARQKTQPSCSSACWMYSRRHGAQSCFTAAHSQRRQRKTPRSAIPSTTINADHDPEALGAALAGDVRVHPEDARDQRERQQDHADDGEKLEPVLLPVRDDRLVRVLERLDDLLVVVEEVPDALGRVDDVVEVELEVIGEEALCVALEQAQGRALGLDDLAVRDDLLLRVGDVADDLLAAALLELVLDRVQLVPDLVQDREAVVEEVVEDVVEQVARRLREELVAKLVVLLAAAEEVGDGQQLDVRRA